MVKKFRSFARMRVRRTALALVSGGQFRAAEIKRGRGIVQMSDRQANLLLNGRLSNIKRSASKMDIVVGIESDNGDAFPVELVWNRERPEDTISIAEVRSIKRELVIKSREQLRRLYDTQHVVLADCHQVAMTLDGRKIFNPAGFTGSTIWTAANSIALSLQARTTINRLHSFYPRANVRPVLIDLAAARFAAAQSEPEAIVVVGPLTTSVMSFDGQLLLGRHVFSIGEEGIVQHLRRVVPSVGEREIRQYMRSGCETTRGDRELTAHATPAARKWARALEHALAPFTKPNHRIVLVSGTNLPAPLSHLFKPQVLRHAFPELHQVVRIEPVTIAELLSLEPFNTLHDALFSLLLEHERLDPFVQ